jgi:hypothetical protein
MAMDRAPGGDLAQGRFEFCEGTTLDDAPL